MTAPMGDAAGLLDLDPVAAGLRPRTLASIVWNNAAEFGFPRSPDDSYARMAAADRRMTERLRALNRPHRR